MSVHSSVVCIHVCMYVCMYVRMYGWTSGGLGSFNPRIIYYAKKLSFYLNVLNSDDEQTQHTTRQSFELHMKKRKCEEADTHQENFYWFQN